LKSEHADVLSAIASTGKLEKASEEALAAAIKSFKDRFVKENSDAAAA
jgi:F0F1-type ATP synthase alpha subunit